MKNRYEINLSALIIGLTVLIVMSVGIPFCFWVVSELLKYIIK